MKTKEGLRRAFQELRTALKACDAAKLDRLISDEYQRFSLHGTIETKKDILDNFKPGIVTISEYAVTGEHVEVYDVIGIITGRGTISGLYQAYPFHHDVLFTDVFKHDSAGWRYHRSHVTEIKQA